LEKWQAIKLLGKELAGGQDKMFSSQKHVFWEAFLVAILIFGIGIFLGVVLENWRTGKIEYLYQQSEVKLLDIRTQSEIYSSTELNCKTAIEENLKFADRIYEEAKALQRYEEAGKLTESLKLEHEKYDVLRALLWANSINVKKKCRADYHNVVYIYKYNDLSINEKQEQTVFSSILSELKQKKGAEIVLIPMAGDNNLASVSLMMSLYNVTESELPIILINEKIKITELKTVEEIEKLLK